MNIIHGVVLHTLTGYNTVANGSKIVSLAKTHVQTATWIQILFALFK